MRLAGLFLALYSPFLLWAADDSLTRCQGDLVRNPNEIAGSRPTWVWEISTEWTRPYSQPMNEPQKKFLEKLGAQFERTGVRFSLSKEQMVLKFNEMAKAKMGWIEGVPGGGLLLADSYVGGDGKLIFVEAGYPPPPNAISFRDVKQFRVSGKDQIGRNIYVLGTSRNATLPEAEGLHANIDFYYAIAQGFFPISYGENAVSYNGFGNDHWESEFLHDLCHAGGFDDHPSGSMAFRAAMSETLKDLTGPVPNTMDRRIFYVSELLNMLRPGSIESLNEIVLELSRARTADDKLIEIVGRVLAWHHGARLPFGGALRGASADLINDRLDVLEKSLSFALQQFKYELNGGRQYTPGGFLSVLPSLIAMKDKWTQRKRLMDALEDYVSSARALSQTSIAGWFETAMRVGPLAKNSPYYYYLCARAKSKVVLRKNLPFCGPPPSRQ